MCAHLDSRGLVDGCITNDGDAFLYGARTVYRNFNMNTKVCLWGFIHSPQASTVYKIPNDRTGVHCWLKRLLQFQPFWGFVLNLFLWSKLSRSDLDSTFSRTLKKHLDPCQSCDISTVVFKYKFPLDLHKEILYSLFLLLICWYYFKYKLNYFHLACEGGLFHLVLVTDIIFVNL